MIENVVGAPLFSPVLLCGSMFGLETHPYPDGWRIERHRLFETSFPILFAPACQHDDRPVCGIYGRDFRDRRRGKGTNHRSGSNIPTELGFMGRATAPMGCMDPMGGDGPAKPLGRPLSSLQVAGARYCR